MAEATPRTDAILEYLYKKFPEPLTDRMLYYIEATAMFSLECAELEAKLTEALAAKEAADGRADETGTNAMEIFGVLVDISLLTDLHGEVDSYSSVHAAVKRKMEAAEADARLLRKHLAVAHGRDPQLSLAILAALAAEPKHE